MDYWSRILNEPTQESVQISDSQSFSNISATFCHVRVISARSFSGVASLSLQSNTATHHGCSRSAAAAAATSHLAKASQAMNMLTDVDLDSPAADAAPPTRGPRHAPSAAPAQRHPTPSGNPERHVPPTNAQQRTVPMRGRRSYHFSMKRPRRNVAKRSISSLPMQLEDIDEDGESLLGMDMNQRQGQSTLRASRLALVLVALVFSAGGYRGISDYRMARQSARQSAEVIKTDDANTKVEDPEDVTHSFRGMADGEHRGALMLAADATDAEAVADERGVEDTPALLFDDTIAAPAELSNLANVFHERYNPEQSKLFLWHIPRSGATSVARIASHCMGLTLASEAGKSEVATGTTKQELQIVEGLDGMHFANVDMSNPHGIELAKSLGVGQSERIHLVSSPYLWDAADIFDESRKGYMVAMFRHPIERAASLYYSMRKNPQYEEQVASLTSIEQYAKSSQVENNWMTRFLTNTLSGELTPEHEAMAKEVLRTKCIVGLLRDKTETMRRLEMLFNLHSSERSQRRDECQEKLMYWNWPGKNRHPPVAQGSEAWDILLKHNTFDLRLYEYAERLFEAQRKLFQESPVMW